MYLTLFFQLALAQIDPYASDFSSAPQDCISSCAVNLEQCQVFHDTLSCCQNYCQYGMRGLQRYADAHMKQNIAKSTLPTLKHPMNRNCVVTCNRQRPEVSLFSKRRIDGYCEAFCTGMTSDLRTYLDFVLID